MSKRSKQLRSQIDSSFVGGYQIVKARERRRQIPNWVNNKFKVQALLLRSFPKLRVDKRQREAAARWARVIQLYFGAHYTFKQVAEEMQLTNQQVKGIIRSIRRVFAGLRADGSGVRSEKKGRPKVHAPLS